MQPEVGSLYRYPYINYIDYKTKAFNLKSVSSANLIWNSKCSLTCSINNKEMVIPSNSIVLLDKRNSFSCKTNQLSQVKVLGLNSEIFSYSQIFFCGFVNAATKKDFENYTLLFFKNEDTLLIKNAFTSIEQVIKEKVPLNVERLNVTICSLLHNKLKEKFAKDAKDINRFGELLNSQFNIFHNVSDYASQLNIESKNLLRLFQKNGLKNPSEIIKEKLLLESKKMIVYTDKSMREICFEVGFSDPAYFSRFFKKHTEITAQCFRRQYANS